MCKLFNFNFPRAEVWMEDGDLSEIDKNYIFFIKKIKITKITKYTIIS